MFLHYTTCLQDKNDMILVNFSVRENILFIICIWGWFQQKCSNILVFLLSLVRDAIYSTPDSVKSFCIRIEELMEKKIIKFEL